MDNDHGKYYTHLVMSSCRYLGQQDFLKKLLEKSVDSNFKAIESENGYRNRILMIIIMVEEGLELFKWPGRA